MRKAGAAAVVEAEEVQAEPVAEVPVARVLAAQAREPVAQAPQAERVKTRRPEEHNRDPALEVLAKEDDLRILAGRVIPLTRQIGRFRGGLRHRIRLQHREPTGSTRTRRLKGRRRVSSTEILPAVN